VTRLPPSSSRSPIPQSGIRVRPTTYTVAVYILGFVLVLEFVMVLSVFWLRAMVVPINFTIPKAHASLAPTPTTTIQPLTPTDVPNLAVSGRRTLLALPTATDKQSQIGNLLDQARLLRGQGDLKGSIAAMTQAEDLDPRNPALLQGMAEVYYLLDDAPRSKIYWQRLVDLGPAVGGAYSLALDHIRLLTANSSADAIQAASVLDRTVYIASVEKTPVRTESGVPQFHLRTVLMRKDPTMPDFDQKKLQPYVIFYQQMPDGTLVPDLRPHKSGFDNMFLFWNKQTKEPFTVDYSLPVTGTFGPDGKPMGEYYGFVIGIYYDKTLQDVHSEPADLITRLPLPDGIE
jgi:hypothetical protein